MTDEPEPMTPEQHAILTHVEQIYQLREQGKVHESAIKTLAREVKELMRRVMP